eukprot:m.1380266 g.1380266  ORF g.1380266 m.1380266 type:complete len:167 (+) comp24968_c0_seq56:324-824(+)
MNRPGMNPCVHLSLCVSACVCVAEYLCVVLCVFGCVLLSRSWLQRCDCDCSGPTNLPMPCSHPHAAIDPQVQPKNVTTDLVEELSAAALDNQVTKDEWLRAMLVSLGMCASAESSLLQHPKRGTLSCVVGTNVVSEKTRSPWGTLLVAQVIKETGREIRHVCLNFR